MGGGAGGGKGGGSGDCIVRTGGVDGGVHGGGGGEGDAGDASTDAGNSRNCQEGGILAFKLLLEIRNVPEAKL